MNDEIKDELEEITIQARGLKNAKTDQTKAGHQYALGMARSAAGIRGATDQQIAAAVEKGRKAAS